MHIITIEGIAHAGKKTAMSVLYSYIRSQNQKVAMIDFSSRDSAITRCIDTIRREDTPLDLKTLELLKAADKQYAQRMITEYEQQGIDVLFICNYIHSGWAYGAYEHDDLWLKVLTHHVRQPDAVFFLDVEPEVSLHRRHLYPTDYEGYVQEQSYLHYVRSEFQCLFGEQSDHFDLHTIDANQPILVTKFQILNEIAKWYYKQRPLDMCIDPYNLFSKEELSLLNQVPHLTSLHV